MNDSLENRQPNILVYHPTRALDYRQELAQRGVRANAAGSLGEALDVIADTEVLLSFSVPPELLQQARRLRWIQNTGAGVDHLLRLGDSIPEHVQLTRILHQFGPPMAEYVFSYLLYLTKGVERILQAQHRREWAPFDPDTLTGKTIGIAGIGSIGEELVRKARAFDMRVYGLSASGRNAHLVDRHFGPAEWLDFVKELDVLVLVLPLTAETTGVVDASVLAAMKPGGILVNIGRGPSLDESAVLHALQSNHLRAAVLDVFCEEPLPPEHPFWTTPNLYVTPHMSGVSSIPGVSAYFVDNLGRYMRGEPLVGLVDRRRGY